MHEWRNHPKLVGKYHSDYPDDLQVIVHEGGPRTSESGCEVVWTRITDCTGDLLTGTMLNQPKSLPTLAQGDAINVLIPQDGPYPIRVTQQYLGERDEWTIHPCQGCGLTELFDPPSELIRLVFPGLEEGQTLEMFTAFCGFCGGVQVVQHGKHALQKFDSTQRKPWWQFWRK